MIHDSIAGAVGNTPVVRLERLFRDQPLDVMAKLEYLNPLGSMKDRAARHVIESWLADGTVRPGSRLVESSSGNFGIALAALAPLYGLRLTCVLDPNTSATNLAILDNLGADIDMVWEQDTCGGYLETRLARVRQIVARDPDVVWVNQYANDLCWQAHYEQTATEVLTQIPGGIDVLMAAVSTTATLQGLARRLRAHWPTLRVVAVDAFGSVIFGGRRRPGGFPGTGRAGSRNWPPPSNTTTWSSYATRRRSRAAMLSCAARGSLPGRRRERWSVRCSASGRLCRTAAGCSRSSPIAGNGTWTSSTPPGRPLPTLRGPRT